MEWLFIFGLCAICAALWNRLQRAEQRLEMIDRLQEQTLLVLQDLRRIGVEPATSPQPPGADETAAIEEPEEQAPSASARAKAMDDADQLSARIVETEPQPAAQVEEPAPEREEEPRQRSSSFLDSPLPKFEFDFEDIFGRRLPIWAGGVALAIAGVFLVRYAIDAGLLTPVVRVGMAFLFGLALIGGAEAAYRLEEKIKDPRVAQALAGAGLATLYAGFYLAGTQYGLIGQTVAFLGLAAVTAAAIGMSFRFGLPSAILGLVGGFAAPALVGGEEANLPLLSLYLGLVTAGLTLSGRKQDRPWMGITAMVGGLGWGAILLLAGDRGVPEILALGLYFLVLGTVIPAFAGSGTFERPMRLASAAVASFQLALLVEQGGFAPLAWGLYLLMGAALAYLGWQRRELREANAVAALVGLLLLAIWQPDAGAFFALVAAAIALIFAGVPLAHFWRKDGQLVDLLLLGAVPPAIAAIAYGTFGSFEIDTVEPLLAAATLALAAFPAAAAWLLVKEEKRDIEFAAFLGFALALLYSTLLLVTPGWTAPLAALPVLAIAAGIDRQKSTLTLVNLVWIGAMIALVALFAVPRVFDELEETIGLSGNAALLPSLLRWAAVTASFAYLAWRDERQRLRQLAECATAALLYCLAAQVLPGDALAWCAALLGIACWFALRDRVPAQAALALITGLWALVPAMVWLGNAMESLAGTTLYVGALPSVKQVLLRLLPATAIFATVRFADGLKTPRDLDSRILAAPLAIMALHTLYKQIFAIETVTAFIAQGLAERTLWEALLLAGAWITFSMLPKWEARRLMAVGITVATLAHFLVYTGLLHNPLWDRQAVGVVPVANLAPASYAVAVGACLSLRHWIGANWRPWIDGLVVALVAVGSLTLLRQAFAGSILVDDQLGQTEELLRSLLGIVLAIGFLLLGARRQERSWRVGSLVLMLLAVGKVFIFDAAGLEGLLRIASFMALGFSLIGIGWLYSKQLKAEPTVSEF